MSLINNECCEILARIAEHNRKNIGLSYCLQTKNLYAGVYKTSLPAMRAIKYLNTIGLIVTKRDGRKLIHKITSKGIQVNNLVIQLRSKLDEQTKTI